jgi:hypothetical protein
MTTCRTPDLGLGPTKPVPNLEWDKRIQAMANWFSENLEDPSEHTSCNGQKGGFQ